jgi:peptide-methionine (R)-S-oxide reductase
MFDSDIDREKTTREGPENSRRRAFLIGGAAAFGGLVLWQWNRPHMIEAAAAPASEPKEVTVVTFSDAGVRLQKEKIAKVVKSDEEWRKQLPSGVYDITRRADTEIAYTGKYWNLHDKGIYRCICCDNALFDSATKFDSGTGWPSFWQPIASENVRETRDSTLGMVRIAISCTQCDAHLGHVFDDGPPPTHLRYCMNSASLRFVARS